MIIYVFSILTLLSTSCLGLATAPVEQVHQITSHNTTNPGPGLRAIPNPFIWKPSETTSINFDGLPLNKDRPDLKPGVSPNNWRSFVHDATQIALTTRTRAQAPIQARVPGNRFVFESTLRRPTGTGRRRLRRLRFEMEGDGAYPLRYVNLFEMLEGLLEYTEIWVHAPPHKNDQVRMCNMTAYWVDARAKTHDTGDGSVKLIFPDAVAIS